MYSNGILEFEYDDLNRNGIFDFLHPVDPSCRLLLCLERLFGIYLFAFTLFLLLLIFVIFPGVRSCITAMMKKTNLSSPEGKLICSILSPFKIAEHTKIKCLMT